jgi:chitodextrinase
MFAGFVGARFEGERQSMIQRSRGLSVKASGAVVLALCAGLVGGLAAPAAASTSCVTTPSGTGWSVEVCLTMASGVVTGDIPVTATATTSGTGAPRVAKLEFLLRGQDLLTDYEAPYAFTLRTADYVDGPAAVGVVAAMRDGSVSSPPATLTPSLANGVTTPPGPTGSYTPPSAPPATQTAPLVLAAVGDGAGGETAATDVTNMIASWNPGLMTYLGDVYEQGTITEFRNWYGDNSSWYGRFRGITAPVVGNHEYNSDGAGGYVADGYFRYWNDIGHRYSFDAGGWHFIALDSTNQFGQTDPTSEQYDWLAHDLATRANPCTIVTYHHPLNTIGSEDPSQRMADIWALLRQHNVTLVLNGHDHQYQHWTALDAGQQPDPAGVTQLIAGAGGHSKQNVTTSDARVVASAIAYGALRLEVRPDRVDYSYRAPDGSTGKVLDSGFIGCKALSPDTQAPSVPPGVTAVVNPSSTAIYGATVSWQPASDNRGVAQYRVRRDGVVVGTVAGSTTSFVSSGLSAGSTYSFTVTALDAAGNESAPSSAANATTPPPTPSIATVETGKDAYVSASSTASNYGTATALRLDGSPDQSSYLYFNVLGAYSNVTKATLKVWANNKSTTGVTVKKVATTNWLESGTGGITYATAPATGAQIPPVTPIPTAGAWVNLDVTSAITGDGEYTFNLSTTTPTAFTLASREAGALTRPTLVVESLPPPDTTAPSAPAGLGATVLGESEVDLAWSASTDTAGGTGVAGYTVYRDGAVIDLVPAGTLGYKDTNVAAGRAYSYAVDATDGAGNRSAQSSPASAITPDETPPGLPDPYAAAATSTTTVQVAWGASTDNVGVIGYRLRRDDAVIGNLPASATSFVDTDRTPGAEYTYGLQARDTAGNWSDPVTSTVTMPTNQGGQPPTAPTAVAASALGETSILLEWTGATDDTGISGYEIKRNGLPVTLVPGTATSWTDSGLALATTYTYTIRAIDLDANYSPPSVPASAMTWAADTQAPTVPAGLAGAGASLTSISLSWDASTDDRGVASYRVYRDNVAVADVGSPTTGWTDSSLSVGQSHQYAVDAIDAAGNRSAKTAAITVRTQVPPPVTQTFAVTKDAYVNAASPTTNYGSATTWKLDGDPIVNSYLAFAPTGLQPVVTSVKLWVYANAKSSVFAVKSTANGWNETGSTTGITYTNAPAAIAQVGSSTATSAAGWVSVPLTAAVSGNGTVSFVLSQSGTTAVAYQAKEAGGATAAYLEVTSSY